MFALFCHSPLVSHCYFITLLLVVVRTFLSPILLKTILDHLTVFVLFKAPLCFSVARHPSPFLLFWRQDLLVDLLVFYLLGPGYFVQVFSSVFLI